MGMKTEMGTQYEWVRSTRLPSTISHPGQKLRFIKTLKFQTEIIFVEFFLYFNQILFTTFE